MQQKEVTSAPAITFNQAAAEAGISRRTLDRLVASGTGPKILRLSARCVRIRRHHFEAWLAERENVPGP